MTRVRGKGETGLEVYKSRVFAISGASPGYYGAMRSLLHLRQILEVGARRHGDPAADRAAAREATPSRPTAASRIKAQQKLLHRRGRGAGRRRQEVRRAMRSARDRLIVALDVPSVEEARALIEALGDSVGVYKIGLELLFAGGIALASELASRGQPSVPRREASRHRGDGRARHRGDRAHGRRVSHRARASTARRSMPRCADAATASSSFSASPCSPISGLRT